MKRLPCNVQIIPVLITVNEMGFLSELLGQSESPFAADIQCKLRKAAVSLGACLNAELQP